jgi:endo-1,4-beta-xylanase
MRKTCLVLASLLAYPVLAQRAVQSDPKGLKDYYQSYFTMGVAVSPRALEDGPEAELIKKHFASLTPENVMKPQPIHPSEQVYNWAPADRIVDFAQANGMKVRGHTLCWHNQTPDWFFKDEAGNTASKEVVLKRLRDHIANVVGRYKGKIYAWDVVNEAVPDGGESLYRATEWYRIVGEEYIAKAFEYAHAADPEALLFYNDYNTENPAKREKIYRLLKALKEKGVPIHGVGLQGHWSIYEPTAEALEASISKFADLGLAVQITELDVSVYAKNEPRRELRNTDTTTFTPAKEQMQLKKYRMIMEVCRNHKDKLTGVTFWNISDRTSWLDNFPVRGRKDYPLLFDQNFQPKRAYWEVVNFRK